MKFDPKKMLDDTLDQMNQSSRKYDDRRRDYGHESDVDDLIYSISRDMNKLK